VLLLLLLLLLHESFFTAKYAGEPLIAHQQHATRNWKERLTLGLTAAACCPHRVFH